MFLYASVASARTPEIVVDTRDGVWMGAGTSFVHQTRDQWQVFDAQATVNALAIDDLTLWIATDDGVVRFETQSQRQSRLTMDDGLPSQSVTSVAVDRQFVWFGTNKGLARYRKLDRTWRVYADDTGLPHRAVQDIVVVGDSVWVATRGGLAAYDAQTDSLRSYTVADGLASDYLEELYVFGEEIWCRSDVGLSSFAPTSRRFSNYSFRDLGGQQIRFVVPDGDKVWIGTEGGLLSYESASGALVPFVQQGALESRSMRGLEPFTDYVFITTDSEVVQYHKTNRTMRRFTEADGLARRTGVRGTVLSGGQFSLLFDDMVWVLDIQRDLWLQRSLARTSVAGEEQGARWQLWSRFDASQPRDLDSGHSGAGGYATAQGGAGLGAELSPGRSLDASALVDYGELELAGVRDAQVEVKYRGREDDVVREVDASDKLSYRTLEEGLEHPLQLAGGHARLASAGLQPTVSFAADGGVRRGISVRDFLSGPRQEVYQLSQRYVLPSSERVYLDGALLTSGVDYTMVYTAGQLAFLDPESTDDLSIIEVHYEYDVMPKKGLGTISLLDLLPADNELGGWARASEPTVVSEQSGLFLQIDGAAPKYIDRGWVRSVFAEYRQGGRAMRVWVHDMGTSAQAQEIFDLDMPSQHEAIGGREEVLLDTGLATSFAVKAHTQSFYIELSIDERSDVAEQSIRLFATQVLDRGENAGKHIVDARRESLAAGRAAFSPVGGFELGGRVVQVESLPNEDVVQPRRRLLNSVVDGRFERELASGGRFVAYSEGAVSHDELGDTDDGYAGMGQLRLSHAFAEGSVSARHYASSYTPIGGSQTRLGLLRDEVRTDATFYPQRWLPASVLFLRQISDADPTSDADADGSPDRNGGVLQQATGRLQLAHPSVPSVSAQLGQSLIDTTDVDGDSQISRWKAVGRTEYDFAEGVLKPLGMKRLFVSGLYSVSDARTTNSSYFTRGDRNEVSRLDLKFAPTGTESAYAAFRSRQQRARLIESGDLETTGYEWSLTAGARSAIIPGIVPQVHETLTYKDDRPVDGVAVRQANASLAGQLGVYPGEWLTALAPVALDTRYSMSTESRAEDDVRALDQRLRRIDNRMMYNGMGYWELWLQQAYQIARAGEEQERNGDRLELRQRAVFRPVHAAPITLRIDYVRENTRNDQTLLTNAPVFGRRDSYEGGLWWQMRWDARFSTKVGAGYVLDDTRDLIQPPSTGVAAAILNYRQHQARPELELRYLLQGDRSSLFLIQRDQVFRSFTADGTGETQGIDVALGVIWSYADNVYLDSEVAYRQVWCVTSPCSPTRVLTPRLLLTAKL